MKKLKVGIIGLEFGATCHLPVFKKNNKCEVIALCSNNLKKAKSLAKKGISGLEFLAGIPGTIGGALAMNAGAYGV